MNARASLSVSSFAPSFSTNGHESFADHPFAIFATTHARKTSMTRNPSNFRQTDVTRAVKAVSDVRRREDEAPASVRGRRCCGDRRSRATEQETVPYLRTGRSARLFIRGAVADHCP